MVQVLVFFGQIRTRRGAENGPGPVFDRLRTGFWMGDAKFAKMLEKCGDQAFFQFLSKIVQIASNRKKNAQQCFLLKMANHGQNHRNTALLNICHPFLVLRRRRSPVEENCRIFLKSRRLTTRADKVST
jgi:hypothetical protein